MPEGHLFNLSAESILAVEAFAQKRQRNIKQIQNDYTNIVKNSFCPMSPRNQVNGLVSFLEDEKIK
jgi:hypothetical protein